MSRALLSTLIDRYFAEMSSATLDDVRARQAPPWISIGHGAAGIAYAAWRVGRRRGSPALLELAHRWWHDADVAAAAPDAFCADGPPRVPVAMVEHSLCDAGAGLSYLGALIAHELGDHAARDRALARFADACAPHPARPAEILHGTAGLLVGALTLARITGRGGDLADMLAAELLADPRWHAAGAMPRFAHGTAGILAALLQWAHATGRPLPAHALAALDAVDLTEPRGLPPELRASWCNGLAGYVILFAHAYRHTQEVAHLARARAAIAVMARTRYAWGNLCCGLGGRAYALLALARAAPSAQLERRARDHAVRAIACMHGDWPNGLLRGWAGMVCLAVDLVEPAPDEVGFPLIEA